MKIDRMFQILYIQSMDLDRKYDSDFELYHNDSEDMSNQTIEIFISIN